MRRVNRGGYGVSILVAAVMSPTDAGATGEDGRAILKKSVLALKKIKLVSYEGEYRTAGWITERLGLRLVKGQAVLGGQSKWGLDRFRCDATLELVDQKKPQHLTAGSNGDLFYLIDHRTKTVYEDIDSGVLGTHGPHLQRILMREFNQEKPFREELAKAEITLDGNEEVDGTMCHKLSISGVGSADTSIWFISKTDYLPRRVHRIYAAQNESGESGSTVLTISNISIDPKFGMSPFRAYPSEGFTKTDDFAP